jgi:hypothetical protein
MLIAAQRTAEAGAEWAKQRRHALVPYGGIFGATAPAPAEKKDEAGEEERRRGSARGMGTNRIKGHRNSGRPTALRRTHGRASVRDGRKRSPRVCTSHTSVSCSVSFFFFRFFYLLRIVVLTFILSCPHRSCGHTADVCALGRLERHGRKAPGARGHQSREWRMGPCLGRHRMELPASEQDHDAGRAAAEERRRLLELAATDMNP